MLVRRHVVDSGDAVSVGAVAGGYAGGKDALHLSCMCNEDRKNALEVGRGYL